MALLTIDDVFAGLRPPENIQKAGIAMSAIGRYHSHWYSAGLPGAGAAATPGVNGRALTTGGTDTVGQIPFTNPVSGITKLAKFGLAPSVAGTYLLCDRLWVNSGLSLTSLTAQAISPVALPARDRNGTTDGVDVLAGLEFSATGGAGTPVVTLTYTDSDNNTGNTASFTGAATSPVGTFYAFPLAAGDKGIRAPTSYINSVTWTSGAVHLVLYRILAVIGCPAANVQMAVDYITGGSPQMFNDSVPFILQLPTATTATSIFGGQMIVTQG